MSPPEKASGWLDDLLAKLREDLAAAEEQARLASDELTRCAAAPPERPVMALISVCIDRAYTALESGFRRIARGVDEATPSGDDWHKALLHQMSLPIQDRRPVVLSARTVEALDVLRRHRHWLRHAYTADFEWSRLEPSARALAGAIRAAREDIERFVAYLSAQR